MQAGVDQLHLFAALIIEIDEGDAAAGTDPSFIDDHLGAR